MKKQKRLFGKEIRDFCKFYCKFVRWDYENNRFKVDKRRCKGCPINKGILERVDKK